MEINITSCQADQFNMKNPSPLHPLLHWRMTLVLLLGLASSHLLLGATSKVATSQPATTQPSTSQPATSQPSPTVKSVREIPFKDIQAISKKIDALVAENYRKHKIKPNSPANDETLLRRYYLAIAGRIPTYDEIQAFNKTPKFKRRTQLIDDLLDSPAYVSDMFNFYADLLRIKSRNNRAIGEPYINWVKQSIRESKPYNQMVYEMLTAEGYVWNNGAVGYYQRDMGMPLDNMSNTTRVFLGTQVGCAQCHDHPFDAWTQMEFHEMSAYTYGISTTNARYKYPNLKELYKKIRKDSKGKDKKDPKRIMMQRAAREMLDPLQYPVFVRNKELKLPDDYQYDDAKPKSVVKPRTIFGDLAKVPKGHSRPEVFAKWMTDVNNPKFTLVMANRLWKDAFGVGLIEPADDIKEDTQASNPKLMAYLTQVMVDLKYDVKQFQRAIYNTKVYQRQATQSQWDHTTAYHYPGPLLQRMSAEQIWDSILTLAIVDLDERQGNVTGGRGYNYDQFNQYMKLDAQTLYDMVQERADNMQRRREYDNKRKPLEKKIRNARNQKKYDLVKKLKVQMNVLREEYNDIYQANLKRRKKTVEKDSRWKGVPRDMVRASQMQQPAKPGHFLRAFGQSDREITNNDYDDSSIPQILALMNGSLLQRIVRKESVLVKEVKQAKSGENKLKKVWQSILTRNPTTSETTLVQNELDNVSQNKAFEDIVWALINTREFMFIQ